MSYYGYPPYVPVAKRREKAAREMEKLRKKGQAVAPVVIEGRKIARSFWGKAWCDNLERYSDYENRLPRGRTYVRNGSVVDLQIERGQLRAMVSGSSIYKVKIDIGAIPAAHWRAICEDCLGSVGSLVELLSGKLSKNVMERVCREGDGLFPAPAEIKMSCSCPDGARMCKHVAAALYGAGARLDAAPDLLFTLRGVDRSELIAKAGADLPMTRTGATTGRVLADDDVAALFGVEMAPPPLAPIAGDAKKQARSGRSAAASGALSANETPALAQPATKKPATKRSKSVSPAAAPKRRQTSAVANSPGVRAAFEKTGLPKETVRATAKTPKKAAAPATLSASRTETNSETNSRRQGRAKAARSIKPRTGKGR
jgi:uncharacterized Zn finger protein